MQLAGSHRQPCQLQQIPQDRKTAGAARLCARVGWKQAGASAQAMARTESASAKGLAQDMGSMDSDSARSAHPTDGAPPQ
mmetsp:Transcript_20497/g.44755  ORF Transcript_20497/g.44755 Transcript_20497/m.44755 type:complete len:80 (+) Transcript_20497:2283-2522(+)